MDTTDAAVRSPRRFPTRDALARDLHLTSQGIGIAATAVMLAATMVIAFAAPI